MRVRYDPNFSNGMNTSTTVTASTSETPVLFWWLVAASVVAAMVPTVWVAFDLNAAALFFGNPPALAVGHWWWVELINLYIPALFRSMLLLALLAWVWARWHSDGQRWRLPLAFVVLAGILGPGLVVNNGFKDHWQRARPYQVVDFGGTQRFTRAAVMTDQCQENCSFVSGHVSCGFFWVALMLLDRDRKRRIVWAITGIAAGLLIGFARMADGAHWLSDVLWACPITLLSNWLVWKFLLLFNK